MGLKDVLSQFLSLEPFQPVQARTAGPDVPDLATQLAALQAKPRPWRLPSIDEALGVPSIQRAVTLISNSVGSLSMQGFRNGALMDDAPRVISRPDPYSTPRDFYRDSAYNMATRGEVVWWIASRLAGFATALVVVPLNELTVEANPRNRLFPIYRWGSVEGTRYSTANPSGEFVHITYLKEPGALRGVGPLQLAGAAVSVAVEAQEFAANFYADGGKPPINLHSPEEMDAAEAAALRAQWVSTPSNMPQVTAGDLELREVKINAQGAQMLDAREYQNGDSARAFGIPGALMEYNSPGSSLTYQNLAEVWTQFVRGCLAPNYLEPIEQAATDLLPRSTTARFYIEGLLRADIKTRWDVYAQAVTVLGPEEGAAYARDKEGLVPGNIEVAAVPPSAPAAVPARIPSPAEPQQLRSASEIRCTGTHVKRQGGVPRLAQCGKLLSTTGAFVGRCPRCHKDYEAA